MTGETRGLRRLLRETDEMREDIGNGEVAGRPNTQHRRSRGVIITLHSVISIRWPSAGR